MDTLTRADTEIRVERTPREKRNRLLMGLGGLVALGVLAYGGYWFAYASHFVSTDNAYVGAETAIITPLVGGPVAQVPVRETQEVKTGDVLVQLDDADARLDVTQAQASLAEAQTAFSQARTDLQRRRALAPGGAVSADELTSAQSAYASSSSLVAAARARLEAAQLTLTRMTIRAPLAGVISNKNVQVGQRVDAGERLMVIAPVSDAYVDANFKEGQLRHVAIGQPVTLHSDLYGDHVTFHGNVRGLSGGTGSAFSLIPAQNASGNWIKVVQRVPVRISLDPQELHEHPLRVGMSMTASIDVSHHN